MSNILSPFRTLSSDAVRYFFVPPLIIFGITMAVFVALFFGAITPNVYFGFLGVATFVGGVVLSAIALHSKHTTDIMLEVMHNGALLWCGSMLILSFTAMALPKLFGLVPGP